jgi:hypothetical protein
MFTRLYDNYLLEPETFNFAGKLALPGEDDQLKTTVPKIVDYNIGAEINSDTLNAIVWGVKNTPSDFKVKPSHQVVMEVLRAIEKEVVNK